MLLEPETIMHTDSVIEIKWPRWSTLRCAGTTAFHEMDLEATTSWFWLVVIVKVVLPLLM